MAAIKSKVNKNLSYVTSSKHKETTPGLRVKQDNVVKYLTNQLRQYIVPFFDAPARHFKTGIEIESKVIDGLLVSQEIEEDSYITLMKK